MRNRKPIHGRRAALWSPFQSVLKTLRKPSHAWAWDALRPILVPTFSGTGVRS